MLFFLLLTFLLHVLRYTGSDYTNIVFGLSLFLLGIIVSLYLVRILYFVVMCSLTRLRQSNREHSTTGLTCI
jgi:hypothetical protein